MKLRNKNTGDIKDICEVLDMKQEDGVLYKYYSLADLNKEWEDYVEPTLDVQERGDVEVSMSAEWFIRTLFGGNVMLEEDDTGGEE